MKRLALYIFITLIFCGTAVASSKAKQNKQTKVEVPENWYVYSFIIQEGYRSPATSHCIKSNRSPAESAEERASYGANYRIIEQLTRKDKPVVVDIQTVDIRDIGYDYTSSGRARSYYTETSVIVDRYIKGEKLCNQIRESDQTGELDKRSLDRFR